MARRTLRPVWMVIGATLLGSIPAAAQPQTGWQNYDYPEAGFAVHFPAPPTVSHGTYSAGGRAAPATLYSVRQGEVVYTVTLADFSKIDIDGPAAIAEAVKGFAGRGQIKLDVDARINSQYGHELSVVGHDGGRSMVGIFFFNHRLYELEGRALPPDALAAGAATIRFQQSLQFPFD